MIHQLLLLQWLLRGLPHEIDMQQHAQAAHKFHLHSSIVGSAPLTVCRATIGCSQKANKQFNSMRSRGRERRQLQCVACCKGYRLCNTYAKLQCCSKSPRRHSHRQSNTVMSVSIQSVASSSSSSVASCRRWSSRNNARIHF